MQNQAASAESGSSDDKTTDTSDAMYPDADAEDTATEFRNVYKDGTYTGEAEGYGGTIQVEVTLTGDEITSINVVSAPGEDSAYLSQAESVIDSILSAQSTDVDTAFWSNVQLHRNLKRSGCGTWKGGKLMKKRQREVRLMRAGIQLAFFIAARLCFLQPLQVSNRSFLPLRPVSRWSGIPF